MTEEKKADPAAIEGVPRNDFETLHSFTALQWEKLKRNAHKGGWAKTALVVLRKRLDEELREMDSAAARFVAELNGGEPVDQSSALERFRFECADVANFCMMLADRAKGLLEEQRPVLDVWDEEKRYMKDLRSTLDGFNAFRALASKGAFVNAKYVVDDPPGIYSFTGWVLTMKYRGNEYGVSHPSFDDAVRELLAAVEPAG